MNKLEANISLFIITFFAAIQYVFLVNVSDSVSHFAFLCITNFIGFVIMFIFFFGELFRLDKKQIVQTFVLSAQLFGFNVFMLLGSNGTEPTVTACVLSAYFVFIPILSFFLFKIKANKNVCIGIAVVLIGLFLMMEANVNGLLHINILYLVVADIFFAVYILTTGRFSSTSNPSILAMGQMFFNFIFALIFWVAESILTDKAIYIPKDEAFWGSVIYISFFIRGIYGIIQIYAQRYVTPLNTSLIFSTEIIMTMAVSPILSVFFGTEPERITPIRVTGAFVMVLGILISDNTIVKAIVKKASIKNKIKKRVKYVSMCIRKSYEKAKDGFFLKEISRMIIGAVLYLCLDLSLQLTKFSDIGSFIGIKNFLPATGVLFMGMFGILGEIIGCILSGNIAGTASVNTIAECISIFIMGIGVWFSWHIFSKNHKIEFKGGREYLIYGVSIVAFSAMSGAITHIMLGGDSFFKMFISYMLMSLFIGIPINILLGGLLCLDNAVPPWYVIKSDFECEIDKTAESLSIANERLEEHALKRNIGMKRLFEIQSCLEELSIRIFRTEPETKLRVSVMYGDAISIKMYYAGIRYNPLYVSKGDDIMDIAGLRLIRHHAIRASYGYRWKENCIHIVL